jgi:hypothetical protein
MSRALLRVLWAVAVCAALTAFALATVVPYAKLVRPLYRWELGLIAPEYQVEKLDLDPDFSLTQPAFEIKAKNRDELSTVDGTLRPRSLVFTFHLLVMQALGHVVMLLFVPLAWPGLTWKRRAAALACAIPILFLVESADVPWALVGGLDVAKRQYVPGSDSLAAIWLHITSSGGSYALGLAGGVLACRISAIFEDSRVRKPRRDKSGKRSATRKR